MQTRFPSLRTAVFAVLAIAAIGVAANAFAQPYSQLQVLLPGETAAPGTGSGKLGTPLDQTVGVPFNVTIRACDANWNTVTSITDIVSFTSTDASASLPGPLSLAAGTTTVQVTFNAAGSFTVSANDDSDPTIPTAVSAPVTALFLDGFEFSRINQKNQYAGVPMNITVTAVDPAGNPVTGYNGPVTFDEITSFGIGRITPSSVSMTNGTWTGDLTMYRADETSINRGNVNIYAYLASSPAINGTSDPFTVHPGPFSRIQIVVPGEDPTPGSVTGITGTPASQAAGSSFSVILNATDDYWNPLPSADVVRVTSSDPGMVPVNATLSNGTAMATVTLATVGTQTLTATDQTNGSIQSMTSAGIAVIASAPDHFEINTVTGPITAGSNVAVTIRATDVGGNTVTNYVGDAFLSANTGSGSISPQLITFSAGVWSGNMVFRGAGAAVQFSCSDFSTPPHVGTSNSFQVVPDAFIKLQVLLPGQTPAGGTATGVIGLPDTAQAGTSFNVTVRAVDQFWNRVPGVTDRVSVTSSDAFAVLPSDTALINGELVFPGTLFRTGPQTITATDLDNGSITAGTSNNVFVVGGPYSRIVLIAPGEFIAPGTPAGRAGTPTDQSINFAFTLTVYATDEWFNPVVSPADVIRITSDDPLAQLPPDTPLSNGVAQMNMRLSTGGFSQITATNLTQPAMPQSTTDVNAISSGFHLEADVNPSTVGAGEPFILDVRVVNDAGSVIQEINSFVSIEVQNASTQAPGRGTLSNTQFQLIQGQRSMSEFYTYAEDIVLIVTDDAGNAPAVSAPVSVTPGQPAAIQLSSNPAWVAGNRHATLSAAVVDAYDNGVPDEVVVFSLLSGGGTLTQIDSLTTANGVAAADFLSPRFNDVSRIRAVSGPFSDEYDLETALVDPTLPGGYITNYPNPFHPDETPTTIAYKLSDNANVTLRIFTVTGGLVFEKRFSAGTVGGMAGLNEFSWDGRNGDGRVVASGGYVLYVQADGNGQTLHEMRRKIGVVR